MVLMGNGEALGRVVWGRYEQTRVEVNDQVKPSTSNAS